MSGPTHALFRVLPVDQGVEHCYRGAMIELFAMENGGRWIVRHGREVHRGTLPTGNAADLLNDAKAFVDLTSALYAPTVRSDYTAKNRIVFGVHRGGSIILTELARFIAERIRAPFYSPNLTGEYGICQGFLHPSYIQPLRGIFAVLRAFQASPFVDDAQCLVLLRDPRDVLTSLFYSFAYSHSLTGVNDQLAMFTASGIDDRGRYVGATEQDRYRWQRIGVDAFVREFAPYFKSVYGKYCQFLDSRPDAIFLRYEDMVEDFPAFAGRFVTFLGGSEPIVADVMDAFGGAFKVEREDRTAHKRQIAPGDHNRKLRASTIDFINREYSEALSRLGYAR